MIFTSEFLDKNYLTIISIVISLHIGLISFLYPKIIEIKRTFNEDFPYIYKYFSNIFSIKFYFEFITSSLLLNLSFLLFEKHYPIILISIFSAMFILVITSFTIYTINIFVFNLDNIIEEKVKKIDFSINLEKTDGENKYASELYDSIQNSIFVFINSKNLDYRRIKRYLNLYNLAIDNYRLYLEKNNTDKSYSSKNKNNAYYSYPMRRLLYINQESIERNNIELSLMVIEQYYKLLESCLKFKSVFVFNECYNNLFILFYQAIKKQTLSERHIISAFDIYINITKMELETPHIFLSFLTQGTKEWIWKIIKNLIDQNLKQNYLIILKNQLYNLTTPSIESYLDNSLSNKSKELQKELRINLYKNTKHILIITAAYLLYSKKIDLLNKYINVSINDSTYYFFPLLPLTMQEITKVFFIENDIPSFSETNDKSKNYFYRIMLLSMIIIYEKTSKHRLQKDELSKNSLKSYLDISNLKHTDSNYTNLSWSFIDKELTEIVQDELLFNELGLKKENINKYKDFIKKYVNQINKKISTINKTYPIKK